MNKELPIILASHGPFAQGALECVELLIGTQQDIEVVSVHADSNIDQLRQQMQKSYDKLHGNKGVLILVDLIGGTPCNLASELVLSKNDITLYCGFNIPILLEVLSNRHLPFNEITSVIEDVFPHSCINVGNMLLKHTENNEDQL